MVTRPTNHEAEDRGRQKVRVVAHCPQKNRKQMNKNHGCKILPKTGKGFALIVEAEMEGFSPRISLCLEQRLILSKFCRSEFTICLTL